MNELSLFTGAGGGVLGTMLLGWRHIGYVEYDGYCQKILRQRIADGILDAAPIFGDIRGFVGEGFAKAYKGMVDVLTAGFPCQPFSVAGKQKGADDERNMWPITAETIRIIRPRYVLLENVPGLLSAGQTFIVIALEKVRQLNLFGAKDPQSLAGRFILHVFKVAGMRYFGRVLGDLAESGYDAEWTVLGADDAGAPHRRKRVWIVAHDPQQGDGSIPEFAAEERTAGSRVDVDRGGEALAEPQGGGTGAEKLIGQSCESVIRGQATDVADAGLFGSSQHEEHATGIEQCREDVADAEPGGRGGRAGELGPGRGAEPEDGGAGELPDAILHGPHRTKGHEAEQGGDEQKGWLPIGIRQWPAEPDVGRVAHGVASRVDRLKALGNGQVPRVVAAAWRVLMGRDND